MSWIQTRYGVKFDLLNPQPEMVNIGDIAHALSHQCRFTGHTRKFYSVAQHSVEVSKLVPREHAFAGLMHDATEAYVADIATPLKALLLDYKAIEDRVWVAIAAKFGLPRHLPPEVKTADTIMLMTERRDLIGEPVESWSSKYEAVKPREEKLLALSPRMAREWFLKEFARLSFTHKLAQVA